MDKEKKNTTGKKLSIETIISIGILVFLALIAAGILISQSSYDLSTYGIINDPEVSSDTKAKHVDVEGISIDSDSFKALSQAEAFNAETLYEKINGKAPMYLSSGFKSLITRRFVSIKNSELWMEIFFYDMGSLNNAFSVYSRQRRIGAVNSKSLYAYETKNTQTFIRGDYYIEINGSKEDAFLLQAIKKTGEKIRKYFGSEEKIPLLDIFSQKYLVSGSEKLYLSSAFGFKKFKNVYSASYRFAGEKITVFISPAGEPKKIIKSYIAFLTNEDAETKKVKSDVPGLTLLDWDGSIETIFSSQKFVGGVHEGSDVDVALKLSKIVYDDIVKYEKGR